MTQPPHPDLAPGSTAETAVDDSYGGLSRFERSTRPTSGTNGASADVPEHDFVAAPANGSSATNGSSVANGSPVANGSAHDLTGPMPSLAHAEAPTTTVPTIGAALATDLPAPPPLDATVAPTPPPARPAARPPRVRGPRRARLQLRHISPWTVLRFAAVLSVCLFVVWLLVVGLLYGILNAAGVIQSLNDSVTTINGPGSNAPVTAVRVFFGATIVGFINVVLFIALSTIGSVVYNLCADLVGGIEVTLSEREA